MFARLERQKVVVTAACTHGVEMNAAGPQRKRVCTTFARVGFLDDSGSGFSGGRWRKHLCAPEENSVSDLVRRRARPTFRLCVLCSNKRPFAFTEMKNKER